MAQYIRFMRGESLAEAEANARADLERGYSFRGYQMFATEADAQESDFVQYLGIDAEDIVEIDGKYGFRLEGLCGYELDGEQVPAEFPYADTYDFYAIYEGEYAGDADAGDGDLFRPVAVLSVAAVA